MADKIEVGVLDGQLPFLRGGSGARDAIVFPGGNALFKRYDKISNPAFYLRHVERILPNFRFTILGYTAANESSVGYAGTSYAQIVQRTAAAIRGPVDLAVGISFGGFVAMRLAAEHPELVRRLVLLISAHRFSPAGYQKMQEQLRSLERREFMTLARENTLLFRRPWYNWAMRLILTTDRARILSSLRDQSLILEDYRKLFGDDLHTNAAYARRIQCPTLILGGTADQYFDPAAFEETTQLIPGARLQLFPGETHMLPIEKSQAVAAAISQFVNGS